MIRGRKCPERRIAAPGEIRNELLEFDFGASCFQLFLGFFGSFLGHAFEDGCRSAFNKLFGVCKTETGSNFAHCLNDSDLVGSALYDYNVEFSFLFGCLGRTCCGWTGGNCCCCGNTPGFFELFYEIDSFQDGKFAEFFY